MPYTAIPSQSDGNTLTATYLNTVADDIEFLHGIAERPNVGFHSVYTTVDATHYYTYLHLHDYLLYSIVAVGATGGGESEAVVTISYSTDGTTYSGLTGGSISATQGTHTGSIDVSARTVGDPYYIRVAVEINDSTSVKLLYLLESTENAI